MSERYGMIRTSDRKQVDLTTIAGGRIRGVCLQFTGDDSGYFQLDRNGVQVLCDMLVAWLSDNS